MNKFILNQHGNTQYLKTQFLKGKIGGYPAKYVVALVLGIAILLPTAFTLGNVLNTVAVEQIDTYTELNLAGQDTSQILSGADDSDNSNVVLGLSDYNGELKFFVGDEFAGGGVASATVQIYKGRTSYDSLTTDSDGTKTTGKTYKSGDELDIKVTSGSSVTWFYYVVPQVSDSFINSGNDIGVPDMLIRLYTAWTSSVAIGGTTYDGTTVGQTNITGAKNLGTGSRPGSDSFTITVSINEGTDNKGYLSSYDPIEGIWLYSYLHVYLNGTSYETITVKGLDHSEEKGATQHYAERLSDTGLSRWKVGTDYEDGFEGQVAKTMTISLTGYNATSANIAFQVVAWGNWQNFDDNSTWGANAVEVAGTLKSYDIIN